MNFCEGCRARLGLSTFHGDANLPELQHIAKQSSFANYGFTPLNCSPEYTGLL